ncbi:hypothetical protein BJ170DRAFT_307161 [Xylariales sp. AK1849]|nr:hypothetical protein BJ170DRAFT_307161 [Xylariales sp. AK1849]
MFIPANTSSSTPEEMVGRIRKLEEAVFEKSHQEFGVGSSTPTDMTVRDTWRLDLDAASISTSSPASTPASAVQGWTPFELCSLPASRDHGTSPRSLASQMSFLSRSLPPQTQATELFNHFVRCVQPTFGVLHVPSTRKFLDQTYRGMLGGQDADSANLLLLFSIFAGAALFWTSELLEKLGADPAAAQVAFVTYSRLAISLSETAAPSTTALAGIITLIHQFTNADGFGEQVHMLRTRSSVMARTMQINRLDTAQSREIRRVQGGDMIVVELQRRIWWHMVASDWLLAFSGSIQEGTYMFQPKHMNVNYPGNVDDEYISAQGEQYDFPASIPTSMSFFIYRLRLAELCREVVDTIPSILLEPQELDYDTVLVLNTKFQDFIKSLPVFFQLDPTSIQKSEETCRKRPYIAWQRTTLHFSINTRLCRLHRPFHLEGSTNPKYTFSRITCVRSAQMVLELRRSMDDIGQLVGLKPSRFWSAAQHVFLAAIILATDVASDPHAPYSNDRKAEVLAACQLLEESQQASTAARDGIQRSVQTLLSMLKRQPSQTKAGEELSITRRSQALNDSSSTGDRVSGASFIFTGNSASSGDSTVPCSTWTSETEENWGQLWSEFFSNTPGWDVPQWNSLLEGIDFNLGPILQ